MMRDWIHSFLVLAGHAQCFISAISRIGTIAVTVLASLAPEEPQ